MYSERDMAEINGRLRKNWLVLGPVLAALLAAYVYALSARVKWLAMAAGPLLFVALCFGFLFALWPNLRYRGFLKDMREGLSREVKGTVVSISDDAQLQDGAMVLTVRVALDEDDARDAQARQTSALAERLRLETDGDARDERIVYLNASKREGFPGPGSRVALQCFGRHVKSVESGEWSVE